MKVFPFILLLFLYSCDEKPQTKESNTVSNEEVISEDKTPREPVTFKRPSIQLPSSALADFNRVKKKHRFVPFYCSTQDGNLFVTSKTAFTMDDVYNKKTLKSARFGLCTEEGDTLLKNDYDRIGNPGLFSDGIIEVHSQKGYALFDYINKRFIGDNYDIIFPSNIMGYLAIGRKNNDYYKLYYDGTIRKLKDHEMRPQLSEHAKKFDHRHAIGRFRIMGKYRSC